MMVLQVWRNMASGRHQSYKVNCSTLSGDLWDAFVSCQYTGDILANIVQGVVTRPFIQQTPAGSLSIIKINIQA